MGGLKTHSDGSHGFLQFLFNFFLPRHISSNLPHFLQSLGLRFLWDCKWLWWGAPWILFCSHFPQTLVRGCTERKVQQVLFTAGSLWAQAAPHTPAGRVVIIKLHLLNSSGPGVLGCVNKAAAVHTLWELTTSTRTFFTAWRCTGEAEH